ncbi:unnamed protein product [Clavelina lepadiformis]|uniref:Epidermal growth factor receptor kinase substrate 8 n=1 Tax=Clavelina lepadiformis TaxID=159417 RepID=A0ABP0G8H7_CLALP
MMRPPLNAAEDPEPYVEQSVSSGGAQPSAKAIYQQRKSYAKTVASMGEVSEYRVEHLVTFAIDRKEAILTVDDSIRKLQLLDARGKIWTQEIYLHVDDKSIKLIDIETREDLDNFPLTVVQHTQPVINACNYNSICALVIKEFDQKTPDIHLFQCSSIPADIICADIGSAFQDVKSKKGKRSRPDTLRKHRDVINSASILPSATQVPVRERVAEWQDRAQDDLLPSPRGSLIPSAHEDSPEIVAFKIQRDVQMLNHALDDIEAFVSLLQKSAEATRELTVRQSKRSSKKKKKVPGSGVLELRSRLPPQEHFIDCFCKFRFCFNLLAKLKTQLKDPNAVELVHFLFQPLAMIIHTCSGPELARTIKSPMLNKDTIEFLTNCVNTQEFELWQDLGDFWTKSRSDFPKDLFIPPYIPTFMSGWEPPPIPNMETEASGQLAAAVQGQAAVVQRAEEAWKAGGANIEDALKPLSPVPQPEYAVVRKFSSQVNGNDSSMAFKQHVQSHVARNQAAQAAASMPSQRKLCRAMYDFSARNEHELSVQLDDLLDVIDDSKSWWMVMNAQGQRGYVPANLMLLISSATKAPATSSTDSPPSYPPTPEKAVYVPPPPPPPPPPVAPVPASAPPPVAPKIMPVSLTASINSVVLRPPPVDRTPRKPTIDPDTLQEELRQRVSINRKKSRNFVIPKKTMNYSEVLISKSSPPEEVEYWLKSLGFSAITIQSLKVLNGAQIFSLTKEELKQICEDEGSRVYSQLMVQKSTNGLRSSSASSELGKALRRRQEITENGST